MKGIYSALMGVFAPDGSVDEEGLRALIRHNIEACSVTDCTSTAPRVKASS